MSFFRELKRRNVYRVAVLYVVVSWLVLQVTDVFTAFMPLPEWTGRLVFVLLVIGFPIALVLAWAFELTPQGLRPEGSPEAEEARPGGTKVRRVDALIVTLGVLAVALSVWLYGGKDEREPPEAVPIRSMVVLPLENLMNDPTQAYFVTGMHDALITELSKIEALRVISRTSAERFGNAGRSVPEIARELGVEAVVEGSVLRAGDTVRIAVQLIEATSDRHLWSAKFDRQLSDILTLYSEVTRQIADQIRVTLTEAEKARIYTAATLDPQVYELYLQGRYLCDNWSPVEMQRGIDLLQEAIRRDPDNAAAHAQLAVCLQYSAFFGYQRPLAVYSRSKEAAERAVALDERLAEGHVALAGVQYYMEFHPKAALASLNRALELNPASVRALIHASWLLGEAGHVREALERNRRALDLDPLSAVVNLSVGQIHYLNRDFDQATREYETALALDRDDPSLHYYLAWSLEQQGKLDEAIALYERAIALSDNSSLYRAALGHAYGLAGMSDRAGEVLQELRRDPRASPYEMAIVHLGLGNRAQSLDWLEKAYEARDSHLIYINRDAKFDPLRSDPRFVRLLDRLDFPAPDEPLPQPEG